MYRIWTEEVLGFRLRGDRLTIDPAIPDEWPGFELTYRYRSTVYDIKIQRREGEKSVPSAIELKDDGGRHEIVVWLPGAKGVEIGAGAREVAVLA
jgi:cellobiose phosphorylase